MDLGRYPSEIRAIADEIVEFMNGENIESSKKMISILWEDLPSMSDADREKAIKFIASTPSQRIKKIERLGGREAYELLVRARYLALMGANIAALADRFSMMPGQSYRKAAAFSVEEALRGRIAPTRDDMLVSRF